jgi:WD40 repeat protein
MDAHPVSTLSVHTAADSGAPPSPAAPGGPAWASQRQQVVLRCLAASPDGRHLAAGDQQGNLRVWDLRTGQLLAYR